MDTFHNYLAQTSMTCQSLSCQLPSENREGRKSGKIVYMFLKGNLCVKLFCLYFNQYLHVHIFRFQLYYILSISTIHVPDINLFCFGTLHKRIYIMKIIDHTVGCIYMEGILILIIKSEKLVFQSSQKPHCCNRGQRKNSCLQQSFNSLLFA